VCVEGIGSLHAHTGKLYKYSTRGILLRNVFGKQSSVVISISQSTKHRVTLFLYVVSCPKSNVLHCQGLKTNAKIQRFLYYRRHDIEMFYKNITFFFSLPTDIRNRSGSADSLCGRSTSFSVAAEPDCRPLATPLFRSRPSSALPLSET